MKVYYIGSAMFPIDTIILHLDGIIEIGRLRMHIKHIDVYVYFSCR